MTAQRDKLRRMWSQQRQSALRSAAMEWLSFRTRDGADALTSEEIGEFTFAGESFRLMDPQRGIRKPAQFTSALSIRTVWRPEGAARPYEDDIGPDGRYRYKWRGTDADHAENRAIRSAMQSAEPLVWFWGVGTALYQAIFPIYVVAEERSSHQFVVAADGLQLAVPADSPIEEVMRRYLRSETLRRLHQPVFRGMVMRAYEQSCAVCGLRHSELLDAAHIVEDRHEMGVAAIRNGLSLCKIHHAAFDTGILGISPNLLVQIRADILEELDGPLLEHGIKGLHGQRLRVLPRSRRERPDADLLNLRFERFRAS